MTRSSLARDTLFNTLSFSLRIVGVLVATAWIARSLGPENQGRFGLVHWLAAILAEMSLWGLGFASTRFVARALGTGDAHRACEAVALTTRWLLLTLLCAGVAALPLAWLLGGELTGPLLAAIPLLLTLTLYQWRIGVAWGLRRFDIALGGHAVFFVTLMPSLYLALGHAEPVPAALLGFAAARGVQVAAVWLWTARVLRQRLAEATPRNPTANEAPPLAPLIRSYAIQMALMTFLGALLWDSSELPFLRMAADFRQVGIYTVAFSVAALFLRVPTVMALVLLPAAAEMEGTAATPEEIGAMFRRAARLLTLVVAAPAAVLFVGAPTVVEVMYGQDYAASAELVRILAFPLLFTGMAAAGAQTLVGCGEQWRLLKVFVIAVTLKVALCGLLVLPLAARGTALAVALTFLGSLAAISWLASRTFPAGPSGVDSRWPAQAGVAVAAGLGAGLVSWSLEAWTIWVQTAGLILGGGLGGILAAVLLRPVAFPDREALEHILGSRGSTWLAAAVGRVSALS